jgi:branched-chain amino acid transport system permease protein
MTWDILVQTLASGLLIGLIYALVAIGLTLIFGVMDIVNFAHGEFLMFGMYSSFWLFALYALDPIFTLPLTALFLFGLGTLLYKLVIRKITNAPMVSQIFTTFGLMILFRGIAQFFGKLISAPSKTPWLPATSRSAASRSARRN